MGAACLFLAAKVEEQPRKLEHVIRAYHFCVNRDQGSLDVKSEVNGADTGVRTPAAPPCHRKRLSKHNANPSIYRILVVYIKTCVTVFVLYVSTPWFTSSSKARSYISLWTNSVYWSRHELIIYDYQDLQIRFRVSCSGLWWGQWWQYGGAVYMCVKWNAGSCETGIGAICLLVFNA